VINGQAESLHPEGVAYDPTRGAFLVTSLRHGTVSAVQPDGSAETLVKDPDLISTIGIRVDVARNRLLVVNADPGTGVATGTATVRRTAGLGIYDLRTGQRIRYVDLAKVAGDGGEHFGNDVAVAPDGTAYVTDSFAPIVYRIPARGPASVLLRDERLSGGAGFGANGIVWSDDHLVIGNYADGTLWRVADSDPAKPDPAKPDPAKPDPAKPDRANPEPVRELRQVSLNRALPGADGIVLQRDRSLVVVTNKVASAGIDGVFRVRLSRDGFRATVTRERAWPDPAPTAVTIGANGAPYILSGRLDLLFTGTTSDAFTIRRS
jgi:hypothetical protein